MQRVLGTIVGKSVKAGLSYRRRGGQALPGLVVEKLFPNYVGTMLNRLPDGVVIITGTNGKTTTTKMVVHLLKANGKKVLTNSTGSNLTRGIASSISQHAKLTGKLAYDIAVLEIDEATARRLVKQVKPKWVLALNVSRDQLDRFGEVDTIAEYIGTAMQAATEGVVVNARDPHLLSRAQKLTEKNGTELHLFGASGKISRYFPDDYELAAVNNNIKASKADNSEIAGVALEDFHENIAKYRIMGQIYETKLKISGQHNYLNGAAALALVGNLLPEVKIKNLVDQLADVELAFGRGEKYKLKNGAVVELVLVKNPASFTQALASYGSSGANLMIAINDNIADGRDVSWLWDVNFEPLSSKKVAVTSGIRGADIALRLKYDDIAVGDIETNPIKALELLGRKKGDKVILATYTAMLQLYARLSKTAEVVG